MRNHPEGGAQLPWMLPRHQPNLLPMVWGGDEQQPGLRGVCLSPVLPPQL